MMPRPDLRLVPPVDYDTRPDLGGFPALVNRAKCALVSALRASIRAAGDAFDDPVLTHFLAGAAGSVLTVLAAFCWARFGL